MFIAIGSTNEAKVLAVKEVISEFPSFKLETLSFDVPSDVSPQPLSLKETIQGAKTRAKNAFVECQRCKYSFGIESGLMEASETATGFLHVSVCSIFDGEKYYTGLSTGFELPPQILKLVLNKKLDLTQACLQSGISQNAKIGSTIGLIGVLSKGRVDRKQYSKECVHTAILQLENAEWYK